MILRLSSLFVRTLREDPADAEVPSHRLLVRAGYIRRAAPGIYTWLPLGLQVLRNIERIIREEMDAIGAQELQFPALLPREPYEASGRWTEYGDSIFRLKDRKGGDYLLGPTHEEMFTLVVKDLYSSYKDLPLSIYQIQTKYRDEARPRAGLLRGREFVMKDSYSFDIDDAGLEASYQLHRDAYIRIFDRLGFEYVIVKATSGAMGGSRSEEFLAKRRRRRGHLRPLHAAATTPRTSRRSTSGRPRPWRTTTRPAAHAEQTPDTPTIESLVDHLNVKFPREDRPWEAGDTLKNVLVVLKHPDGTREPVAIGVPGDREVDAKRLERPARARSRSSRWARTSSRSTPRLVKGYIGPGCWARRTPPASATSSTPASSRAPAGSPAPTSTAATSSTWWPAATSRPTAPSRPPRSGTATPARTVHEGHARVGSRHRDGPHLPARPQVRRRAGPPGARRERQARHRHHGLLRHRTVARRWPPSPRTPSTRSACAGREPSRRPTSTSSPPARTRRSSTAAGRLADELSARGLTVLYDDRPKVSPGVKFKDAELIGVPTIVTVGRGLADGTVEVKDRPSGERTEVPVGEAVDHLVDARPRLILRASGPAVGRGRPTWCLSTSPTWAASATKKTTWAATCSGSRSSSPSTRVSPVIGTAKSMISIGALRDGGQPALRGGERARPRRQAVEPAPGHPDAGQQHDQQAEAHVQGQQRPSPVETSSTSSSPPRPCPEPSPRPRRDLDPSRPRRRGSSRR